MLGMGGNRSLGVACTVSQCCQPPPPTPSLVYLMSYPWKRNLAEKKKTQRLGAGVQVWVCVVGRQGGCREVEPLPFVGANPFFSSTPPGTVSATFFAHPLSPPQYYEMSYGLNIEMHKQVWPWLLPLTCPDAPAPLRLQGSHNWPLLLVFPQVL